VLIAGLASLVLLAGGCSIPRFERETHSVSSSPVNPVRAASPDYPVVFPDVLEITVAGKPDCSGRRLVYPDGRVDVGTCGTVFAEGCTAAEITRRVAKAAQVPVQAVSCRVAEARSRVVYVVGPGADHPRAVPYTGPERASELLARTGELSPLAHAAEVRVVRRNVARGAPTETFRVDLAAARKGDVRTDVFVEPNDEVHVIEDRGIILAALFAERGRP
jgi:protein involved in polysaccharide export with SLBB domain